jgi:secretion/DNA translocation related TadE-like protein
VCRDRGSLTIWAAALAGLIWLGSSAALLYGSAVAGRHRVETAADLAALGAAVHIPDGTACAVGTRIAGDNGARVRSCQVVGDEVEIVVSRRVSLGGLGAFPALARARAGPAEPAGLAWTDTTRGRRGARRPLVPG